VQRPVEDGREQRGAVAVHRRVAEVARDRVPAVALLDLVQARRGLVEGGVPRHRHEVRAHAPHRGAQPVGIVVELGQRRRLGADVAAAERVVVVAADRDDPLALDLDRDAAHRLAEMTGPEVRGHAGNHTLPPPRG